MHKMYFMANVLPSHLDSQIRKFKEKMSDRFGCKNALKSPAHITLVPPFWMDDETETALKADLDELAASLQPFSIWTENFNCFRPRTIFIEPVLTRELGSLKSATDEFIRTHKEYSAKTDSRDFHPHITIATRDLQRKDFAEAWAIFENKKFKAEWEAVSISLLSHSNKKWDVVHTSHFKNIIV